MFNNIQNSSLWLCLLIYLIYLVIWTFSVLFLSFSWSSLDHDYLFHICFGFFQILHAHFLDTGFPDLGWHPCRCALGFLYLLSLSGEYMHFFCFALPSVISVQHRFAAFRAACLGAFPVKIPISLPSLSLGAKFRLFFCHDIPPAPKIDMV